MSHSLPIPNPSRSLALVHFLPYLKQMDGGDGSPSSPKAESIDLSWDEGPSSHTSRIRISKKKLKKTMELLKTMIANQEEIAKTRAKMERDLKLREGTEGAVGVNKVEWRKIHKEWKETEAELKEEVRLWVESTELKLGRQIVHWDASGGLTALPIEMIEDPASDSEEEEGESSDSDW